LLRWFSKAVNWVRWAVSGTIAFGRQKLAVAPVTTWLFHYAFAGNAAGEDSI